MKTALIIYVIINLIGFCYGIFKKRPRYRILETHFENDYTIFEIEELQRLWLFPLIKMYVGGIDEGHQTLESAKDAMSCLNDDKIISEKEHYN